MKVVISLLIFLSLSILVSTTTEEVTSNNVVEIQPVAFDIIITHYQRVIALFVDDQNWSKYVPLYQKQAKKLMQLSDHKNDTLFAICNTSKDLSKNLQKYGKSFGIKYVTMVKNYELMIQNQAKQQELEKYFREQFPEFYHKLSNPAPQTYTPDQLAEIVKQNPYYIAIYPKNESQLHKTQIIYRRIFDYLELFNVKLYTVYNSQSQKENNIEDTDIIFYAKNEQTLEYPKSAIKALYNFTTDSEISSHQLNDLIDFINIETIHLVSKLNDKNYYRVFGSQLDSQLLLIYHEKYQNDQQIKQIRQTLQKCAYKNKAQELKSHRVLFAEASVEFLKKQFVDDVLTMKDNKKYIIIHTKTQYSTFQLRKFDYPHETVSQDKLLQFIEDVRMKKINANYKSQPIPSPQQNNNRKIRKIVGQTFLSEVFEQSSKSVAVLFIDSKEQANYQRILQNVQQFAEKYHEAYEDKLNFGIFDLAKNQHQLLTIRNAPELVLFERTNKKKPKFFRGKFKSEILKNWVNFQVSDVTIPQNFGEPILPLGGPADLPQNDL